MKTIERMLDSDYKPNIEICPYKSGRNDGPINEDPNHVRCMPYPGQL